MQADLESGDENELVRTATENGLDSVTARKAQAQLQLLVAEKQTAALILLRPTDPVVAPRRESSVVERRRIACGGGSGKERTRGQTLKLELSFANRSSQVMLP
jgi:hypothetical protein